MARPREFDEARALEAALGVFWDRGYEATSVQHLTERMGIQKASFYNAFGDKHALFVRALTAYQAGALAWYRGALEGPGPLRPRLRRLFDGLTEAGSHAEGRGCFCVNSTVELAPHDRDIRSMISRHNDAAERIFQRALERAVASGELPRTLAPRPVARFLLNVVSGLAVARKRGAGSASLRDVARITLSVLDGT